MVTATAEAEERVNDLRLQVAERIDEVQDKLRQLDRTLSDSFGSAPTPRSTD